ncbi:hypothetical protein MPOCJGCO_2804 [Methylobacterium trifolii]|uniref:Uncharacterized protein n=1 Tax=Methylobacterium trifolii TaxID=1003092 RepID=A0ABQ4U3L9_9HYPH|nr:hypothetical protein MPOCJGCO_2804 [Methylobacterium trifolii]
MGVDGRYAQADGHLEGAAAEAGLDRLVLAPAIIRREQGRAVEGRVAVLRRRNHACAP